MCKRLKKDPAMKRRKQRRIAGLILAVVLLSACGLVVYKFTTPDTAPEQADSPLSPTASSSETPAPSDTSTPTQEDLPKQNPTETALQPGDYPELLSESGTYTAYNGASEFRVDHQAFSFCAYNQDIASTYTKLVSTVADQLSGQTNVYSLPIPTAYGVILPDDIRQQLSTYVDQQETIQTIFSNMSDNVIKANCYNNMMRHRDEYLYFRTDHHWNGLGAYYAYEAFCQAKGITPYTLDQREEVTFDGFLGTLYQSSGKDPQLLADTVYAYKPHSQSATMVYYDQNGAATSWPIICDVSQWAASSKYNTFAGGDHPLTVFQNPDVTDGSVCIVVKDSFGNALLPYLVDHYSTIYEIDFRYWTGDLVAYAKEQGADDLIFANNVMMISTGLLVGKLSNIISTN